MERLLRKVPRGARSGLEAFARTLAPVGFDDAPDYDTLAGHLLSIGRLTSEAPPSSASLGFGPDDVRLPALIATGRMKPVEDARGGGVVDEAGIASAAEAALLPSVEPAVSPPEDAPASTPPPAQPRASHPTVSPMSVSDEKQQRFNEKHQRAAHVPRPPRGPLPRSRRRFADPRCVVGCM